MSGCIGQNKKRGGERSFRREVEAEPSGLCEDAGLGAKKAEVGPVRPDLENNRKL